MAIELTSEKSSKPGCVTVKAKSGEDARDQKLVDAIRGASVGSSYDNSTFTLTADITQVKLSEVLAASDAKTNPPREQFLADAAQHFSGRKFE